MFLASKDESFQNFVKLVKRVKREQDERIVAIRSDHGGEFENIHFMEFCEANGILHQFSTPRTPQQNSVVERRNRTLQEIARTMLLENNLPTYFWAEAVNTACYILNRFNLRQGIKKILFELYYDKKPNVSYFKAFGCKCFILNTKENVGKFEAKSDQGIFLGYSNTSKAYKTYNLRTNSLE